jgi:hypothetical protein
LVEVLKNHIRRNIYGLFFDGCSGPFCERRTNLKL